MVVAVTTGVARGEVGEGRLRPPVVLLPQGTAAVRAHRQALVRERVFRREGIKVGLTFELIVIHLQSPHPSRAPSSVAGG